MVSQNAIIAALASTGLISLAPNVLLLLFPHYAKGEGEHSRLLALGQAMAAGGLLGDVFLHTIPHAQGGEDVGLWILLGFAIFLAADMLLRSLGAHGHSHDHDHSHKHAQELKTSAILLNLAADAMHNFTDGLAIGASFAISSDHHHDHHAEASILSLMRSRGGLATLSIMFHEIPHELGDFAVLVKNGCSKRQAIMAQFGTAVAAMAGTMVGLILEGFAGEALIYITAGGFVYLAACTILPELLEDRATLKFRAAQIVFFGAGIAFLYAVSWLETHDGGHHGHSHAHHHHAHEKPHEHHQELHEEHSHHAHHPQAPHGHHEHHHDHEHDRQHNHEL